MDALGEPVNHQSAADGLVNNITATFQREYYEAEGMSSAYESVLYAKTSDGPFREGDMFSVDSDDTNWQTVLVEDDDAGMTRIVLESLDG